MSCHLYVYVGPSVKSMSSVSLCLECNLLCVYLLELHTVFTLLLRYGYYS